MAIVRTEGDRPVLELGEEGLRSLEALVLAEARPAIEAGRAMPPLPGSAWGDRLTAAWDLLQRASHGVGLIEAPEGTRPQPMVGTAFVVAPRLAVTASYVADALAASARPEPAAPQGRLDFGDGQGMAISAVHRVHPNWRFCFLSLAKPVGDDRVLKLASPAMQTALEGREICVIGFPFPDIRNDPAVVERLFGNRFGIKRLMPGRLIGMQKVDEHAPVIAHDATTLGGTGGAPLLDLETGQVIGMNFAGQYLLANYAAPAWEFNRDPQWTRLWNAAPPASPLEGVLAHPRLLALFDVLVRHFASDERIDVLLSGLPSGLIGELPDLVTPKDQLLSMLARLNRKVYLLDGMLPIETVLRNADALSYDLRRTAELRSYMEEATRVKATLADTGG